MQWLTTSNAGFRLVANQCQAGCAGNDERHREFLREYWRDARQTQ